MSTEQRFEDAKNRIAEKHESENKYDGITKDHLTAHIHCEGSNHWLEAFCAMYDALGRMPHVGWKNVSYESYKARAIADKVLGIK